MFPRNLPPPLPSHRLVIDSGDLPAPVVFNVEVFRNATTAIETAANRSTIEEAPSLPDTRSSFLLLQPQGMFTADNQEIAVEIALESESGRAIHVYRANEMSRWSFQRLDTEVRDGRAVARTDQGGIFVAASPLDTALIAGLVVMGVVLIILLLIIAAVVIFFCVRRDKWRSLKENTRKAKVKFTRSFAKQV